MAFTDHKIAAFTHTISDLADQPNLPPDELKARFDACPEELRQAVNAICDEAAALDGKVSGIITGTFGDTIPKSMLSEELQAELDAKATQASVSSLMDEESAAREAGDAGLQAQLDDHTDTLAQKVEIYLGTVAGSEGAQTIDLPFVPKAVIFIPCGGGKPSLIGQYMTAKDEDNRNIAYLYDNHLNFPHWTAPIGFTHTYLAFKAP